MQRVVLGLYICSVSQYKLDYRKLIRNVIVSSQVHVNVLHNKETYQSSV